MMISPSFFTVITFFFSFLLSVSCNNPTANLSTSWINSGYSPEFSGWSVDGTRVKPLLMIEGSAFDTRYACGFYCKAGLRSSNSYLFAIFITRENIGVPEVVWAANRNNPVRENATLQLTAEGDLVLRDVDGALTWSTDTAGRSVVGLNLTEMGNLVLFDVDNTVVWQSLDHPTDALVPGQILVSGMNLTASAAQTYSSAGLFTVSMTRQGLAASILSNTPRVYYEQLIGRTKQNKEASYAKFQNGSLGVYIRGIEPMNPDISIAIPQATSFQYMKLGPDGHLRVIDWGYPLKEVADIFNGSLRECDYPMVCGNYGICSNGQCSCPDGGSFRQTNDEDPDLCCSEVIPLSCNASGNHGFLDLEDVTYFDNMTDLFDTDMKSCKEACLKNCSCKAVIFRYGSNYSVGDCYLPSEMFSLMKNERPFNRYNSTVSLKVQIAQRGTPPTIEMTPTAAKGKTNLLGPILGSTLGVLCVVVAIGGAGFVYRKRRNSEEAEEDYQVPGMPTRFSFEKLATATDNFSRKLGEGGFGTVFEGSLNDGTRIAVKRLNGVGHIGKSFLAEVQTIGSIHHINLIRLIGFCAEKSQRLLVYEYMCNGSLDRWIYCRSQENMLGWNSRRKIILDIAKGLSYLHEECRQKIFHLDIKPQNILVDKHYNAKIADFGLSKLIDRSQSKVVATMRGTPGYLAPEWLSAVITEKVDVYSFGIVILEIACGRKNFEQSRPEEERHLLTLFKKRCEKGQWLDIVDKCCQDVESNAAEVEEMMQIAAWCLQSDHEKRPCMSMVIKVLEGVNVQRDINYNFLIPQVTYQDVTCLLPSVLSGPR